jgi:hypothetical protein
LNNSSSENNNNNITSPSERTLISNNNEFELNSEQQQRALSGQQVRQHSTGAVWKAFTANYVYDITTANIRNLKDTFKRMDELDAKVVENTYLKRLVNHHPSHGGHVSSRHAFESRVYGGGSDSTQSLSEKFDFNGLDVIDLTKLCSGADFQVPPPPLQFSDDYHQNNECKFWGGGEFFFFLSCEGIL